jgi:hypothetical protein
MKPPHVLSGRQIAAARALTSTSQSTLAEAAGISLERLKRMEANAANVPQPDEPCDVTRVRRALENAGALFIAEDLHAGAGVRLKFNRPDTRQLGRWEGEGGSVANDDVP